MSNPLISILLKQTQHLTQKYAAVSDGDLLHQYVAKSDQLGFAGLVRRHGPMVWAVCRNALRTESDAEDAFQATFLALVRNAKRIRNRESLGAWLHGVAVRICLKSRLATARRLARETKVAISPGAGKQTESWHDDIVKVHECINILPRREQDVFVLTVLEGIPQSEVARQLGLNVNSVSGLLSRARKRLQTQLKSTETKNILALTVAVSAPASVPAALFTKTCGLALTTSGLSLPVLALTASLTEFTMRKFLLIAILPMFLCSGFLGGRFLLSSSNAQQPPAYKGEYPASGVYEAPTARYTSSVPLNPAQKWEYKTIRRQEGQNIDAEMNALGEQGWELCSSNAAGSNQVMLIFKRQKQTTANKYSEKVDRLLSTQPDLKEKVIESYKEKLGDKVADAPQYRLFRLQRTSAMEVAEIVKKINPTATVVSDTATNSLHVQAEAKQIADIAKVIQKLDGSETTTDAWFNRKR